MVKDQQSNLMESDSSLDEQQNEMAQDVESDQNFDDEEVMGEQSHAIDSGPNQQDMNQADNELTVKLSNTLFRKLGSMANDEGLSLTDLVEELLSESVTLRAWEIIEKKNTMRSSTGSGNSNNPGKNNNQRFQRGGNRNNRRHNNPRRSNNSMQNLNDSASFIEYVRNQEKKRR